MNPFRTGKLVLFQVEYNREWHYFEIVFFLLIGIMGGLYGEYVLRFNLQVQRFRKKYLANYGVQEAVILASVTAMICYFNRFLRLDMTETLELLFQQCDGASDNEVLCQSRMQWSMAGALMAVGATVLLQKPLGIEGVCLAMLVAELLMALVCIRLARDFLASEASFRTDLQHP